MPASKPASPAQAIDAFFETQGLAGLAAALGQLPEFEPEMAALMARLPLRHGAVLVPLFKGEQWSVLLTRRSQKVSRHKGQIAFPGGKVDATDPSFAAAALRETEEEIGIPAGEIELLGPVSSSYSSSGFRLHAFAGLLPEGFEPRICPYEVEEIIPIPLEQLLQPGALVVKHRAQVGPYLHDVIAFRPREGVEIWGATAWILRSFLSCIAALPPRIGGDDPAIETRQIPLPLDKNDENKRTP